MISINLINSLKAFVKQHPVLYSFALHFLSPVLVTGKSPDAFIKYIPADEIMLNIGAGPTSLSNRFMNVDIHNYKNVDIVADVHKLPFKSGSIGCVVSIAMLEHVENPISVVDEIYRILRPGGYIYSVVPFVFGYHSAPNDYYRWTKEGVKKLFVSFVELEAGVYSGPTSSMLIILQEWLAMLFSFQSRIIYQILYLVFMVLLAPFKIIDYYLSRHPEADKTAASFFYAGRKQTDSRSLENNQLCDAIHKTNLLRGKID